MKRGLFGTSILLIAALVAACGGGGGGSGNSGGGGSGNSGGGGSGASSTGGSDTGGGGAGGSNTGGTSTGGGGAGGMGGTGGTAGSGGGGAICGGLSGAQCGATELCDFPDDSCSIFDSTGTCVPRPQGCPDNVDPVCACDGTVYFNACEAQAAGYDINAYGGCTPPAGQFSCGAKFCAQGQQYCQVVIPGVPGAPYTYSCEPLPAACSGSGASCACFGNTPCGDMCKLEGGGFTLTCAAP